MKTTTEKVNRVRERLASTRVAARHSETPVRGSDSTSLAARVSLIDGILISRETLADLVKCLDLLATLARDRGATLPEWLGELRSNLSQVSDQAITRDASRKVTTALELAHSELGLVNTATAARMLKLKEDSVRDLCRRECLASMQIEGRWWIAAEDVRRYRAERKG